MINLIKHLSPKRITGKLFLITASTLLTLALVFYVALYLFLPSFYEQYKIGQIDQAVEELVTEAEEGSFQETYDALQLLSWNQNLYFHLLDENYNPLFSLNSRTVEIEGGGSYRERVIPSPTLADGFLEGYSRTIPISIDGQSFNLYVNASLQPVSEATEALFLFLPYIIFFAIILSIGCAYFFSKQISKPLLRLNDSAQSLAQLDFNQKVDMDRDDEIGELAGSIHRMSENLEEALDHLQEANTQLKSDIERERAIETKRREYFSAVSHELKSPITILKGQLEGMLHNIGPYKERDHYLQKSIGTTESMEALVQDMLKLSRLEQSMMNTALTEVDVTPIIHQVLESLDYFRLEKDMDVDTELPSELIVLSDEELLYRVLFNIIHNGFMYSSSGEHLIISATEQEQSWTLTITNTGVQLADNDLEAVFQPFYRVEKSRNRNSGGSGLGLYLAAQMAQILSADYKINNTTNGVCFTLILPTKEKS